MDGSRKETLNFDGFSGYYGYMSYHEGYGGFNWYADFLYMNDSTWTNANGVGYQYGWCDTGQTSSPTSAKPGVSFKSSSFGGSAPCDDQ